MLKNNNSCFSNWFVSGLLALVMSLGSAWAGLDDSSRPTLTLSMNDLYQVTRENLLNENQIENLSAYEDVKIVLVPGIATELYSKPTDFLRYFGLPVPNGLYQAMYTQYDYFKSHGMDVEFAPISTLTSCTENGDALVKYIRGSSKKMVFITHSKGSLDLLNALVTDPSIKKNIASWVSLQAPFAGTPLGSFFFKSSDPGMDKNFAGAVECLSETYAKNYLIKNQERIHEALKELSWVFLTTWKQPGVPSYGMLDSVITLMNKAPRELRSDGLIPTDSGCLLDYPCLVLENLDHASTVMDVNPFFSIGAKERVILSRTLMEMARKNFSPHF